MEESKGNLMDPRLFFSILLSIIIGWFAVGAYASSEHLEHPVFLDHYLDEYSEHGLPLELYYITNKDERNTINYVMFGEIMGYIEEGYADVFSDPFTQQEYAIERYGLYELRSVRIVLDPYEMSMLQEEKIFNEMTVHFSDRKPVVADIGEIIIHPYEQPGQSYLTNNFSMNGTEGSASIYQAEEKMSITALIPHLPEEYAGNLKIHPGVSCNQAKLSGLTDDFSEMHAEGEDHRNLEYPLILEKGEEFAYTMRNTTRVSSVINSWMMIEGTTDSGKTVDVPAFLLQLPEWESLNIKAIIERKGAAK